jgi:putative cell wall-binding protein
VLVALQPEEVTVVGGENVVGEAVLHELRSIATTGRVDRISGPDRYATAARLTGTYPTAIDTVYVATATNYPDALSAAARAGREDAPVLLVSGQTIPEATAQAL